MLRKIESREVQLGMYIVGFGGSWFDHPFWRGKFVIDSPEDLAKVTKSKVPYVLIDETRGKPGPSQKRDHSQPADNSIRTKQPSAKSVRPLYRAEDADDPHVASRRKATALVSRSKQVMRRVFDELQQGWAVDAAQVDGVLEDIVEAVDEDAKTLLSVTRLKSKDDYTYLHSVAVCTLMVCVARHRNMSPDEVRDLGLAGLLHDIGKIGIPDPILNKPGGLTDPEFAVVRNHPQHGHQLLSESPGITPTALDVCLHHHEKMDGTGYPFGLSGSQLSFAARLGAVCDVFDALTSQRAYKKPWSPQKALGKMWNWKGHFDRAIMFELMQILHIYPAGLLVRLSNQNLAVTMMQGDYSQSIPVTEVFSAERNEAVEPNQLRVAKDDPDLRIEGFEEPSRWGLGYAMDIAALGKATTLVA